MCYYQQSNTTNSNTSTSSENDQNDVNDRKFFRGRLVSAVVKRINLDAKLDGIECVIVSNIDFHEHVAAT